MFPTFSKWLARICLVLFLYIATQAVLAAHGYDLVLSIYKHSDKVTHFLAPLLIALLALLSFPKLSAWITFTVVAFLCVSVELAQKFVARSPNLLDLIFSWLGLATVALSYYAPRLRALMKMSSADNDTKTNVS